MVGDGNIYYNKSKRTYRFVITGHSENDFNYLTKYVSNLAAKLFAKKPSVWMYNKKRAIAISLYSREIIDFLLLCGLKSGRKSQTVEIPKIILKSNKKIKASFLRGLADADFFITFKNSRNNYPIIIGTTSSKILAYQVKTLLKEFSINASIYEIEPCGFSKVRQYKINCYAMRNFNLWMKNIGFKNECQTSKIQVWKKLGRYPSFSNLKDRMAILNNSKSKVSDVARIV